MRLAKRDLARPPQVASLLRIEPRSPRLLAMTRPCIAVIGPGDDAPVEATTDAAAVGRLVAERGWVLLCGGRAAGVMDAAARGARDAGGPSVGILPGVDRHDASLHLTVALPTGLGEARNAVLITAADAVVACGMNPGTASELGLALRARKPTVLVRPSAEVTAFVASLTPGGPVEMAAAPRDALDWIARQLPA